MNQDIDTSHRQLARMRGMNAVYHRRFFSDYLIFSRHYAAQLERYINEHSERPLLVAHELEGTYLFPLDDRKIVTLGFGAGFSWFGFMTAFHTLLGVLAYLVGLGLSLDVLSDSPGDHALPYLVVLATLTIAALMVGGWWFVGGTGEERLTAVLDRHFGPS